MLLAKVYITLKDGVLDPQGTTVKHALENLKFEHVLDVRIGKYMEIRLNTDEPSLAAQQVDEMCSKLLANPVIERYRYEIMEI